MKMGALIQYSEFKQNKNNSQLFYVLRLAVRQSAIVETSMTSVERVLEYGELKPEAALTSPEDDKLLLNGKVVFQFRDVSLSYSEDEPNVLKRLSFNIIQGEKVSH